MKRILLILLIVNIIQVSSASPVESYYAFLRNDTLRIGNSTIERSFCWNNGNLTTCELIDKKNAKVWESNSSDPDFCIPGLSKVSKNGRFTKRIIPSNGVHPDYFETEIYFEIDSLCFKRVFRIYKDCPVIASDTYIKGSYIGIWSNKLKYSTELKNIEDLSKSETLNIIPVLDQIALTGKHWSLEVIDFIDATDWNNTLVKLYKGLSYRQEEYKGNILFAENTECGKGVFFLKEAPCSSAQLAYPGGDFISEAGSFKVIGLGISQNDISLNEWTKTYSSVLGVFAGDGINKFAGLHQYQKLIRSMKSVEDEMVMMNTWGDRGKDKKINEDFCLRELSAGARLGITHFQIDDGWQTGRSANSAFAGGSFENIWSNPNYWKPDSLKYPNGLKPVVDRANKLGIKICLWFNPSIENNFADWEKDADAILAVYRTEGINIFKIDGVNIQCKLDETNLRHFFDKVLKESDNKISFNLDVTAGRRGGYFYFNEYGNIFLENRYTDWANYFPYWTLRNLWMLSRYIPSSKIQVDFLNKWRNNVNYGSDIYSPANYSFNYIFAITMAGQPLAWMEGSGLPEEAFSTSKMIEKYKTIQYDFHSGIVLPIGDEPSGKSWTGFQSINVNDGYFLVFRENNAISQKYISVNLPEGTQIECKNIFSKESTKKLKVGKGGKIRFDISSKNNFVMYKYIIVG